MRFTQMWIDKGNIIFVCAKQVYKSINNVSSREGVAMYRKKDNYAFYGWLITL